MNLKIRFLEFDFKRPRIRWFSAKAKMDKIPVVVFNAPAVHEELRQSHIKMTKL